MSSDLSVVDKKQVGIKYQKDSVMNHRAIYKLESFFRLLLLTPFILEQQIPASNVQIIDPLIDNWLLSSNPLIDATTIISNIGIAFFNE